VLIRSLYNGHAALLATALTASASVLIEYATNARGYSLVVMFFLINANLAVYLCQKNNIAAWILMAICSSLGFYTIPIMLYPFMGTLVWIAISLSVGDFKYPVKQGLQNLIISCLLTGLLTGILYLPVLIGSGLDAIINNRFVQSQTYAQFATVFPERLTAVWAQWFSDLSLPLTALISVFASIGILFHRRISVHRIPFGLCIGLTFIICLSIQKVLPPPRGWLFLLPILFGLAAAGFSTLFFLFSHKTTTYFSIALTIILVTITTIGSQKTLTHDYPYGPGTLKDAEQITYFMKPQLQLGDRLITIATAAPLEYYFQKHHVSIDYLRKNIAHSTRLIVLVLENKYTLEEVLHTAKIPTQEFTPPKLWQAYPSAKLYEMHRQTTALKAKNN